MKKIQISLFKRSLKLGEERIVLTLIERALQAPYSKQQEEISGPFDSFDGTIWYEATYKENDLQLNLSIAASYLKEKVDISIFPTLQHLLGEPTNIFLALKKGETIPQITFTYHDLLVLT
ncbi:hypothetical protein [Priestia taiwanensis]|uniref:Uncharacterized protein n=1 Tax=Priestia taiwanensis TaxID=1347902 RepID=A0A917ARR7_9BACI|nr:hypothetical protein [Priestia taiwanensis]MBM7363906.1 hypothetical protein [Priestia taiwanensis]GGE69996.1 hypothetical protein GCM10007140_19980 [Priestia taiwanensis]